VFLTERNAVLGDPTLRRKVTCNVSERGLQLTPAGSPLHTGRSGAVLLTRTRCPIRPWLEEIQNPNKGFHLFFEDDVAAHPHGTTGMIIRCWSHEARRPKDRTTRYAPSKLARTLSGAAHKEQPGSVQTCVRSSPAQPCAILFHPPDPPIASNRFPSDVRFAQASTAYINGPSKLACCLPGTARMSLLLRPWREHLP
jgi:hypothetical protein